MTLAVQRVMAEQLPINISAAKMAAEFFFTAF
jgi:hypothetical protein